LLSQALISFINQFFGHNFQFCDRYLSARGRGGRQRHTISEMIVVDPEDAHQSPPMTNLPLMAPQTHHGPQAMRSSRRGPFLLTPDK